MQDRHPHPPSDERFTPGGAVRSPEATYVQVDSVSAIVTRLSHLLDGSIRCVDAAKANVAKTLAITGHAAADEACRQLTVAAGQLDQMSELVHAAMQSQSQPIGSTSLSKCRPVTLGEAVLHAIDVVRPLASKHSVAVNANISPEAQGTAAGGMYTVMLNGIQNAVESIGRRGGNGTVTVDIRESPPPQDGGYGKDERSWYELVITDDGIGPPSLSNLSRVFDMGFSSKQGSSGIGLAVARSVVNSMGGTITLGPGRTDARLGRSGAKLIARFPSPNRN